MRFATAFAFTVAAIPALAVEHVINVGSNGQLTFDPSSTQAAVGDTVSFVFNSKNHSATQSTFADPCTKSGFSTGFHPVAAGSSQMPSVSIQINSTDPIWFYCGQKIPVVHCAQGMVGVINPPAGKTIQQFISAAMASGNSSASPSGSTPAASGAAGAYPSASGTDSGSVPSGSTAAAPTASKSAAMRLTSGAAGMLSLVGLLLGTTL